MGIDGCFSLDMLLYVRHYIDTASGECFSISAYDKAEDSFATNSNVYPFISRKRFLRNLDCGTFLINARDYNSPYMEISLRTQIQALAVDAILGRLKPISECFFPEGFAS